MDFKSITFFSERKVPGYIAVCMYSFAGLIDLIELILGILGIGEIVDEILAPAVDLSLYIWFQIYGVSFSRGNTLTFMLLDWILEEIPVVDAVYPGNVVAVWWLLRQNKKNMRALEEEMTILEQNQAEMAEFEARQAAAIAGMSVAAEEEMRYNSGRMYSPANLSEPTRTARSRPFVQDIRPAKKAA